MTIFNTEALHEIQFGHIARPTHASRPFDADRFEVVNHKWTALTTAARLLGAQRLQVRRERDR